MATVEDFVHWCEETPATDVIPHRPLAHVYSDASLFSVLEQLRQHKVHSLPVLHPTRGKVLGMVDVLDIVCGMYDIADLGRFNDSGHFEAGDVAAAFIDTKPLKRKLEDATAARMIQKAAAARTEVIASLPASFDGPTLPDYTITVSDTLKLLLTKLGWDARHRVPVVAPSSAAPVSNSTSPGASTGGESDDDAKEMVDVISQSDLIRYLCKHIEKLPKEVLDTTIEKLTSKVLCKVSHTASMAEVIWLFKQRKVLSLVAEDHYGGFVAPISAHDFISRATDLSIYGMAVDEFLASAETKNTFEIVPPTTTVRQAMEIIVEKGQYRLWIAVPDEKAPTSGRPVVQGVFSIRDVIKAFWRSMPENKSKQVCQD